MKESFELKEIISAMPNRIYEAWLDSQLHEEMTGGPASASNEVGAEFSAWDDYITGKNIELVPDSKIVQSWRTTEFQDHDEDSIITIEFKDVSEGTEITLTHTNLPAGQTQYKKGWVDHYFAPMKDFFSE